MTIRVAAIDAVGAMPDMKLVGVADAASTGGFRPRSLEASMCAPSLTRPQTPCWTPVSPPPAISSTCPRRSTRSWTPRPRAWRRNADEGSWCLRGDMREVAHREDVLFAEGNEACLSYQVHEAIVAPQTIDPTRALTGTPATSAPTVST